MGVEGQCYKLSALTFCENRHTHKVSLQFYYSSRFTVVMGLEMGSGLKGRSALLLLQSRIVHLSRTASELRPRVPAEQERLVAEGGARAPHQREFCAQGLP